MSLPSGYVKLKYIQSTGTQYIDTGFVPNQDTRIDITAMPMSSEDANTGVGFIPYGAAESYNSNAFECFSQSGQLEFNYDGQYEFIQSVEVGKIYNITQMKQMFLASIVGEGSVSWSFTYQAFTCPYTLTLFAIHRSTVFCGQQKVYSCKIYDNGTLIRDYVPCKNSSGVVGLYDLANNKFYINSGTGNFTAGPEVSSYGHSVRINGTKYSILGGRTLIGGTGYGISKGRTLVGGTGYDIAFGAAEKALSSISPGNTVKLNESGSPVEFYVAVHNYEKALNGNRTLLVRKDCTATGAWNSLANNAYANSTIDKQLNGTYKQKLDSGAQSAIGTTSFYYTASGSTASTSVFSRSVFLLSATELGRN